MSLELLLLWACVTVIAALRDWLQQRKIERLEKDVKELASFISNAQRGVLMSLERIKKLEASPCFRMFRTFSPKENQQ